MNKKLLGLLTLPLVLSLGSCGHEHTYKTEWDHDGVNHWHAANCGHDARKDEAPHTGGVATYDHGKICEVCNFEYTSPLVNDSIFGKKFTYNGIHSDFTYDVGTSAEDFEEAVKKIYDNLEELRDRVAVALGYYYPNPGRVPEVLYDKQIEFGKEDSSQTRSFSGKEVTTFVVNQKDDKKLCEFGLDPDNKNVYHFYAKDTSGGENDVVLHKIVDHSLASGVTKNATVTDTGFTPVENGVKFNYKVDILIGEEHFIAFFSQNFDLGEPKDVTITKQPQDLHVTAPEPIRFEVEVDHPELVVSYQWYAGAFSVDEQGIEHDVSYKPILGTAAKKRILEIPGSGSRTGHWCYKCLITTKDREFFSDFGTLFVDDGNDELPILFVLDYPIMVGEHLDLSKTPYGSGVISYSNTGRDIMFDNVHFNNLNIESDHEAIAFSIESWHNIVTDVTFTFVGENIWYNSYWEEDNHQGGFGLFVHYAGESVVPTINFKGDSLTVVGGTRAISVGAPLNIYNHINVVGQPGRLTHGIYAYDITVKSGGSVSGSLGGSILYTMNREQNTWGNITLEANSRVDAVIYPGKVSTGETNMFGMYAVNDVKINEADLSLVIAPDYDYFINQGEGDQNLLPLIGIHSSNGYLEAIKSNIDIRIKATNVPESGEIKSLANTVEGLSAMEVSVKGSNININIDSAVFMNVNGIYSIMLTFVDSVVNVNVHGHLEVSGIVSSLSLRQINGLEDYRADDKFYGSRPPYLGNLEGYAPIVDLGAAKNAKGDFISYVKVTNCKMNIVVNADEFGVDEFGNNYYIDAGIRAKDFEFTLGETDYIHIKTNMASPLVSSYDHVPSELTPVTEYEPKHILLDTVHVQADSYEINQTSYYSWTEAEGNFYVACEAMFVPENYTTYLHEVTLTAK